MKTVGDVRSIRVEIPGEVLESVFEECDRYDRDETGGRVVGHFKVDCGALVVQAAGVIEPGPNARRTSSSFFQDGDYQTEVFRRLESIDATIEHLGNWHTHHVNGYPTLSGGDVATYRRIVNHEFHNLDFFYALLVTRRNEGRAGLDRYSARHYVLFRGDSTVHEVASEDVVVTEQPRVWPTAVTGDDENVGGDTDGASGAVEVRAHDKMVLSVLCPSMEPRLSKRTGTFFWRGSLPLIDGSLREVSIAEVADEGGLVYHPVVADSSEGVSVLCETPFASASLAVRALELRMNEEIYGRETGQED